MADVTISPSTSVRRSNSYRIALRKSGITKDVAEGLDWALTQQEQQRLASEPTSNEVTLAKVVIVDDHQRLEPTSAAAAIEEKITTTKLSEAPKKRTQPKVERINLDNQPEEGQCKHFCCKWCCCCFCCGLCKTKTPTTKK